MVLSGLPATEVAGYCREVLRDLKTRELKNFGPLEPGIDNAEIAGADRPESTIPTSGTTNLSLNGRLGKFDLHHPLTTDD
jgi:hypothetical protein